MKPNRHNLLLLIIAIGAALRIASLWNQLSDGDELWTLHMVGLPWLEVVRYSIMQDFNPPLFYLAAKLCATIGGITITMVRMPSLVSGILLIPVAYLIGREAEDELLGLTAAGLTAILYPVVYYSQYARAFAMAGLFTAIAIYGFMRILKYDDGWLVFSVSGLIALYSHAFTLVPLDLMVLYLGPILLQRRKYLIGASIGAIPFLIMMGVITLYRHQNFGLSPAWVASYIPFEMFGWVAPIMVIFIILAWWQPDRFTKVFTVIPVLTALIAIVASFWTPVFPRYTLAAMPMLAVVAMAPVAKLIRNRSPWLIPVGTLVIVLNLCQIVALWFLQLHPAGAP